MIICNYKLSRYCTYRCIHVRSGTSAGLCRLEVDLFCNRPCPPAYILSSGIGSLGGKWVDRPTMPSTYHNWAMLDNQLEKGFGGMMGGVSIQRLLGKVSTVGSCKMPSTIRLPICCCNNCACAVAIILDLLTLFNFD